MSQYWETNLLLLLLVSQSEVYIHLVNCLTWLKCSGQTSTSFSQYLARILAHISWQNWWSWVKFMGLPCSFSNLANLTFYCGLGYSPPRFSRKLYKTFCSCSGFIFTFFFSRRSFLLPQWYDGCSHAVYTWRVIVWTDVQRPPGFWKIHPKMNRTRWFLFPQYHTTRPSSLNVWSS